MRKYDIYTERLRRLRKVADLSQRDLAKLTGINNGTIAWAELGNAGRTAHETYVTLIMACRARIQENSKFLNSDDC